MKRRLVAAEKKLKIHQNPTTTAETNSENVFFLLIADIYPNNAQMPRTMFKLNKETRKN